MLKIILSIIMFLLPITIKASDNQSFGVGNNFYDNIEDAIKNASSTDTVKLYSNADLLDTLKIDKVVNIDLNGNTITAPSTVFLVNGGTLNITGSGKIKELKPNYGAIRVIGNSEHTDTMYSSVNIEKDVVLEGWAGLFITHNLNKSHGVNINFDGTINAVSDINGDVGIGIYVNGSIKHTDSHPVINILDNAKITSNGVGLYIAGYSTFNIGKSYIEGEESGIGIKSGTLNINGATVKCNGKDTTPSEGYNNGINSSGTAIQIESNNGYKGDIVINISKGNITSKNSSVIYEYIGKGDTTQVKSINITGGTFVSESKKDVFLLSNSFKNTHKSFISGGKFSSNPTDYLKSGYSANLENNLYDISKNAIATFSENLTNSNNTFNTVVVICSIFIIGIILYFNRLKISNFLKKF